MQNKIILAGERRALNDDKIRRLLSRYHEGGMIQREFAAQERIGVSTLQYWLRRERHDSKKRSADQRVEKIALLEVEVAGCAQSANVAKGSLRYEIAVGEMMSLRLDGNFKADDVERLLHAMKEVAAC